jgi:VWFA-related protein
LAGQAGLAPVEFGEPVVDREMVTILRWLLILGLLAATALPSEGAKRLSVAQLEQLLTAYKAAHKQDSEIAKQIAGLTLTERMPQATRARLSSSLGSDPQASLALRLLADQSEFLDLSPGEAAPDAAPDSADQARMLRATRVYASQTLPRLPNFLATRTINLYDDTPHPVRQGEWPTRAGLHPVGTSHAEISVNREREDQPLAQGSAVWQSKIGLMSGGEFGNALGMILTDMAAGVVSWSHWERTSSGLLAVFRYSIPAPASHFEVISSFQREATLEGVREPTGGRGVVGIGARPNISSGNVQVVRTRPAYHGSIWLNPADGTIYRVTMSADMNKDLPFQRAAILVEYGPVEIAGSTFICPVRSLAVSEAFSTVQSVSGDAATAWLNETLFTGYHRFGSSSRIIDEAAGAPSPQAGPVPGTLSSPPQLASNVAEPAPHAEGEVPAPEPLALSSAPAPSAAPGHAEAAVSDARAGESAANQPPSANMPPPAESHAVSPAHPLEVVPDAPAEPGGFTLRLNVNSLLVPAVVLDKTGRAVGGLGRENFAVMDGGKARTITGLTVVGSARQVAGANLKGSSDSTTHAIGGEVSAPGSPSAPAANRFLIFLFDDLHITSADLALVQKAATRLFEKPLPETDYVAVVSFTGVNSGITRDRAALQSAIMKLTVHQAVQQGKEDCPSVDYYSADQIVNKRNAMEFQIAVQKAKQCSFSQYRVTPSGNLYEGMDNPTDPFQRAASAAAAHALAVGEQDARASLLSVQSVVRAMSKLPGQRILILVSSGFLSLSPDTMALKSAIMDAAAASDVIVNALDARGLYAGNIDASEGGTTSTLALVTGQLGQDHLASMQAGEDAMSELAEGTGGRFFHNSNDLTGGLETLTAAPETLYLLEISLNDVKANGSYHRLQVKVDRPGLTVVARKGYSAPAPVGGKK